ncbi:hypothetical protein BH11BAC3_BH11BAC3_38920 [soil metagenome]
MNSNVICIADGYKKPRCTKSAIILFTLLTLFLSTNLFSQAPTITSFSPTSAAKGNTVTIDGTNFSGTSAVSFSGVAATSFTVISSTRITAVVPLAAAGSITVVNAGQTATKTGFYYLPLSGIITDFAGYWPTTTVSNNPVYPDNTHNLLAFTYNGKTYSTGVNDAILTGQGINFSPGDFRSLPVANIAGVNTGGSIYLAMASKVDGNASVANASALAGITVKDILTDGPKGLDIGTGITNLPASALMTFDIHIIQPGKISDDEPDLIITQTAQPSLSNDVFQFIDATGNTVGNVITQDMTLLTRLGTYTLDLFNLSPGAPFNSAACFSAFSTNTTREIRLVGFKLSDFGITVANYTQVAALKVTPSGNSDYGFIAYSDAILMAPNISQNIDRSNSSVCTGGTANLEVITNSAYGGALTYVWEQSVNAGTTWTTVTNGGSFSGATTKRLSIVSPTNTYKYRATVTESGTGYHSTCSPFTIAIVSPAPPTGVSVAATSSTTCLNNLVSLTGTVTGGSNLFYQWQTNASGSYVTIDDALLKTYLPPVSITGVISYRLIASSGSGCSGAVTSSPVAITVVGISSTTPASRCGTGVVTLTTTATSGTVSWYAAYTGGTALTTGNSYAPSISAATTYYVISDVAQCASGNRVPITATINSITWAGTHTTAWSSLSNWDCGGVPPSVLPTPTNNVTIPTVPSGGRFPTISATATVNNITISTCASIIVDSTGIFEIYGAIVNDGAFDVTKGTIAMRGSTQQTIPQNAFDSNTINNLTINNAAGVLMGGNLNVTGVYTPTAGTLTTFGHLTLKSSSSGTARVAAGSSGYTIGNVNVERYVPESRSWRMMTAPLTNSNTFYDSWQNGGVYAPGIGLLVTAPGGGAGIDSAGNSSLKTWNVGSQALVPVYNTKVPISATNNGSADNTAYFIFVRGDRDVYNIDHAGVKKNTTTLTSKGYLQTGTQNFTGLSAVAGGLSLIGNPFASPVNWNLVLSNPGTINLKRKFYVWDPKLNSVGGYAAMDDVLTPGVFNPTPETSSQNNYLQSSQAFFVITNTAGAATLQIKETNKAATNNTAIFGRPLNDYSSFSSNLYLREPDNSITFADGIRADFRSGFNKGVDDDDNLKFGNVNETFGFIRNNITLATERRPFITNRDTLFFKLTKATQRAYQFQFKPYNFDEPGMIAMLEDSYTGTPTLLSLTDITSVNFTINSDVKSQSNTRFRVVFMLSAPLPVSFSSIKGYKENSNIIVNWKVENELNIQHYEVECSSDGMNFKSKSLKTALGNNQSVINYNFIDENPVIGNNFYRIKSVGRDGSINYSRVIKVVYIPGNPEIKVSPNPVLNQTIKLQFSGLSSGVYSFILTNVTGQVVFRKTIDYPGADVSVEIELPASVKYGTYQAVIKKGNIFTTTLKVIIE